LLAVYDRKYPSRNIAVLAAMVTTLCLGALKSHEDRVRELDATKLRKHVPGIKRDSSKNSVDPTSTDDDQQLSAAPAAASQRAPLLKGLFNLNINLSLLTMP